MRESLETSLNAVRHLPQSVRLKVQKLYEDGTIRPGDLDSRCIMNIQALQEPLQLKVFQHIERDRVFFTNARSKAGFIVSSCEKAKRGELDVRGYGSIDPWAKQMESVCVPVKRLINLVPEQRWLDQHPNAQVNIEVQTPTTKFRVISSIKSKIRDLKLQLEASKIPFNQMTLIHPKLSVLRNDRSLAFYNFQVQTQLTLRLKFRGGRKINKPE